jgi:transcriptional regulator with XRE-family HTH domain
MEAMPRPATGARSATLFGRRIRALRTLRKLTQEELGERAGVSGKFIGQVERGSGNPSLHVIIRLGGALGIDLPDLMRFEEQRPEGTVKNAARAYAAAERVSEYLASKPAGEVEKALRILEAALGPGGPRE